MKKIYIHTDLEGVSGVDSIEMIPKASPGYRFAAERLMADLNAAVRGALAGGADEVTVLDSHGGGGNFDLSLLDKRASIDTRPNKKWWGILDSGYAGTFFIGAHAMAGTERAFLDHTQDSTRIYSYSVNGRNMGELAQWAMVAAHFKVPLVMVSGDLAAVNEANIFFPGIKTAVVKTAVSRNRAVCLPPEEAESLIFEAAKSAVMQTAAPKMFAPALPIEIEVCYTRADYCDDACERPGTERCGPRLIRKKSDSHLDFMP